MSTSKPVGAVPKALPFLKWVGGKRQLLPELLASIPASFGAYHEPFVGGGALFFALAPKRAVIADANVELVNAYVVVRDHVEQLIALLAEMVNDADAFAHVRALDPLTMDPVERAVRFVYLIKTGFNGIYRVNKSGGFNVPFGRYPNPTICDAETLRACSVALANAEIVAEDFGGVVTRAVAGDVVYFDPPYLPKSSSANFDSYTAAGFLRDDHERLARVARGLVERGVHVLVSNADVPAAREIYGGLHARVVSARRNLAAKSASRVAVGELLLRGEAWPVAAKVG